MATHAEKSEATRGKLLDAAVQVIREKGLAAASVQDICTAAGLTKGSFFHHFENKEALAIAAAGHFGQMAGRLFGQGTYLQAQDPLDVVLGYVDFRMAILDGPLPQVTCLLGTMVQEAYGTQPNIQWACCDGIFGHAAQVVQWIEQAKQAHCPTATWSSESLGLHTQAVIQGAFILAKAKGDPTIAVEMLGHLKRYIELLFAETDG